MGLYDYNGDKVALQAESDRILRDGVRNDTSAARIIQDGTGQGLRDKPTAGKLRSEFAKPDAQAAENHRLAATMDALNDPKTGRPDPDKMAAAGLSQRTQQELVAAHEARATVESMGRMSTQAIQANHEGVLVDIAQRNQDLMQFARGQTSTITATAPVVPAVASFDLDGP